MATGRGKGYNQPLISARGLSDDTYLFNRPNLRSQKSGTESQRWTSEPSRQFPFEFPQNYKICQQFPIPSYSVRANNLYALLSAWNIKATVSREMETKISWITLAPMPSTVLFKPTWPSNIQELEIWVSLSLRVLAQWIIECTWKCVLRGARNKITFLTSIT